MKKSILSIILNLVVLTFSVQSQGLPENATEKVKNWAIVFDFKDNSCYPAAAISADGIKNGGLKPTGLKTCNCRNIEQLNSANTYCRTQSITIDSISYEVIMYALYFEKDQYIPWTPIQLKGSHRHDWEYASIWLSNGEITHATYSAHGHDGETMPISSLFFDSEIKTHVKVVYHQDNIQTHCMRFAKKNEKPKNELGKWITPSLVQWSMMTDAQRKLLSEDWGSARPPFTDQNFHNEIAKYLPPGYPNIREWK